MRCCHLITRLVERKIIFFMLYPSETIHCPIQAFLTLKHLLKLFCGSALSNCYFLISVFTWLKIVPLSKLFNSGGESHMARLVSMEHVQALVFVFWLKTVWFFGTVLAYTFFMFIFVGKICLTISLPIFNSSIVILICSHKSLHHLPHRLFLLKTSCAIQTHELLIRCFLHLPHITDWTTSCMIAES